MLRRLGRIPWKRIVRPTWRDAAWLLFVVAVIYRGDYLRPAPHTVADDGIETGRDLDVQIIGRGYLTAKQESTGHTAYFRHGHLKINSCGQLSVGRQVDGWTLDPPITIPLETQSIEITENGEVRCRLPGEPEPKLAGRLDPWTFVNDEGLSEIVTGLFVESAESGGATLFPPGHAARSKIKQGRLEKSPTGASSVDARKTDRELDVRVRGRGRLTAVQFSTGTTAYFRPGRLDLDASGLFCIGTGDDRWIIEPQLTIPCDAQKIEIGHDGTVSYRQVMNPQPTHAGQLLLVTFVNEDGLRPVADGGLAETRESGAPTLLNPGTQGTGLIEQGWLEHSSDSETRSIEKRSPVPSGKSISRR
jgi:flagellar basal body rod protein FlgG